jgi:alpha-L-rhamnosidase
VPGIKRAIVMVAAVACIAAGCSSSHARAHPDAPNVLTVDDMQNPIGLGLSDVYFAWHIRDGRRGAVQNAYRIVVEHMDVPHGTAAAVWDSGRVQSSLDSFVPYAGPALASDSVYRWRVQTWDGANQSSPLSQPATFETGLIDKDWKANWIWRPADTATDPDQYAYVRKEITPSASPIVRARIYVSGDQQYELNLNGVRVGKGEAYSFPDSQYYETLDATHHLRAGQPNAIAITYQWDGPTKGHPAGEPGVIAQINVLHADGTSQTFGTDGSWRVRDGAWLPGTQRDLEGDFVDYTENIDGRKIPVGWDSPGFDDASWAHATVIGPAGTKPWTHLIPVRTRIVEHSILPVSMRTLSSGAVIADYGKVFAGVPTVHFHQGVDGRVIKMHAGYLLDPDGRVSTTRGTQHTDMSYSYIERGGTEEFHPFDYLGFRYFEVDAPGEKLGSNDLIMFARHSDVPNDGQSTYGFVSSDPTINAIDQLGSHSALYTAQEQFIDTPTREKGSWLWDGFNESETAMAAFGDQNLTRKSLLEFAQSQARYWPNGAVNKIYPTGLGALDINEFTEIYPEWVFEYWMNTGDRALIEDVYQTLVYLSNYVHNSVDPKTGLVTSLPATNIYYDFPTVTRLNILGVNVFNRVAEIASALGRPASEVQAQRDRATALTAAINERLTRADGVYVDGLDAHGAQVPTAAQDANAAAIVYGVVPPAHLAAVGAYVASLGMSAPPRTASEVLDALADAGRYDDLVRILDDKNHDGWANILAQGGTFTWEVWRPSDIIGDSMSHGWGSNVLVSMQRALLGVTPTAPGYTGFSVTPPRSVLTSVTGIVPTPRDDIQVTWKRTPNRGMQLMVQVPGNSTATISIPASSASAVTESGRALEGDAGVKSVKFANGTAVIVVGAGTYNFTAIA